ncbi:tRNA-dihydrouridine synthase family protein [Candidatus Woesearchaeota archaeon]|nr:tRNA-dihydrouridine synthase family protein [Candidatus Woesearchaeota archaeon]
MKRKFKLDSELVLAPMEEYTDIAFRLLCKGYGSAMQFTEMIYPEGVLHNNKKTRKRLLTSEKEKPVILQLFGSDPEKLYETAIKQKDKFDGVDLNLGCSVKNIMENGYGAALLDKPKQVEKIILKLKTIKNMWVSAKIRLGINNKKQGLKIARILDECDIDFITVHGRTAEQKFSGKTDLKAIKEIVKKVNIPVIGNGDIKKPEDAEKMLRYTGCDYVMVGREALKNPVIFRQWKEYREKRNYKQLTLNDKNDIFTKYLKLALKYNIDFKKIKWHMQYFSKEMEKGSELREKINKADSLKKLQKIWYYYLKKQKT